MPDELGQSTLTTVAQMREVVREQPFHVHPQHADLPWEWIRTDADYGLDYLVTHARACIRDDVLA